MKTAAQAHWEAWCRCVGCALFVTGQTVLREACTGNYVLLCSFEPWTWGWHCSTPVGMYWGRACNLAEVLAVMSAAWVMLLGWMFLRYCKCF
jgi:hypothetical protein